MKPLTIRVRRWIIACTTVVVLILFINRLMTIQIVEQDIYKNMKDGQYISTQTVKATRGEIVDRNGQPLAVNRMGYDVIIDRAYLPLDRQNEVLLELMHQFERLGEHWTDTLPITRTQPFRFLDDTEGEIQKMNALLGIQPYHNNVDDAFYQLVSRYKLQDYSPEDQRKIAGIRYQMEQRGFTWNVSYVFATDIGIESVIEIKERSHLLPGVDIAESGVRNNPNGNIAPHIIGTVGPIYAEEYQELKEQGYAMDDRVGKSGVEKAFEELLRGQNGQRQIHIGSGGEVVEVVETSPPVAGSTVYLSLDNDYQLLAQESLERQIMWLNQYAASGQGREANSGAVVMLDCKTGEILAAATYPSYDLETYHKDYSSLAEQTELRPLYNRALLGVYAPGSTFKPVVATAGLQHELIDPTYSVNCTRVYNFYQNSTYKPTCLGYHGHINVQDALRVSCNIFFYDTGRRLGIENVASMAREFGLGEPTGIEIAESLGQVSEPAAKLADPYNDDIWYAADTLQSSIGQLYHQYTPLQLANYTATIANRGKRMKVTMVHEVRDYTLNMVLEQHKPETAHVINAPPEVFDTVIKGMVLASGPSGTASATFGYYPIQVASKTGTPETVGLPNSVFICFAPADNPRVAIAVVIEKGWHGYTGAPVAKALLDRYFQLDNPQQQQATPAPPAATPPASQAAAEGEAQTFTPPPAEEPQAAASQPTAQEEQEPQEELTLFTAR